MHGLPAKGKFTKQKFPTSASTNSAALLLAPVVKGGLSGVILDISSMRTQPGSLSLSLLPRCSDMPDNSSGGSVGEKSPAASLFRIVLKQIV